MARIEDYYDPWNPDFVRDPIGRYQPLLSRPPLLLEGGKLPPSLSLGALPDKPVVLIARYDDVLTVMRDAVRFSNHRPPRPDGQSAQDGGLKVYGAASMLFSDPPVPPAPAGDARVQSPANSRPGADDHVDRGQNGRRGRGPGLLRSDERSRAAASDGGHCRDARRHAGVLR